MRNVLKRRRLISESLEKKECLTVPLAFVPQEVAVGFDQPTSFLLGDFDGDQLTDVLSSKPRNGDAQWSRGQANGQFENAKAFSLSEGEGRFVAVDDLDRDGDDDLIVERDREFFFLQNNAGDSWADPRPIGLRGSHVDFAFGDVDGDGDRDIVQLLNLEGQGKSLVIHLNSGDQSFSSQIYGDMNAGQVETADIDGDGDDDIIVKLGGIAWIRSSAASFSEELYLPEAGIVDHVAVNDYDNDGDADVVGVDSGGTTLLYANDGGGEFSLVTETRVLGTDERANQIFWADVDGDRDPDVVVATEDDDHLGLYWFENDASQLRDAVRLSGSDLEDAVVIGVIDGSENSADELVIFTSDDDYLFAGRVNPSDESINRKDISHLAPYDVRSLATADIDNDGDVDVISASRSDGDLAWFRNDGEGGFEGQPAIATSIKHSRKLAPMDVDRDGDVDIVSTGTLRSVEWHENIDGLGTFAPAQVIDGRRDFRRHHATVDFDQDGHTDLITASSNQITVYQNDVQASLRTIDLIHDNESSIESLRVADINSDGDMDILFGWSRSDQAGPTGLYALLNEGGQFSTVPLEILETETAPRSFDSGDFNSDSLLDLVVKDVNGVRLLMNQGDGSFTSRIIHQSSTASVDVADVDGNGTLDVLVSGGWITQLSNTLFALRRAGWEEHVSLADIDGDGSQDIVATVHENGIVWYESRIVGDVNNDGIFGSADIVAVFQAGLFENDTADDSSFDQGDWNGDGDFNTTDLVYAFTFGHYRGGNSEPVLASQFSFSIFAEADDDRLAGRNANSDVDDSLKREPLSQDLTGFES